MEQMQQQLAAMQLELQDRDERIQQLQLEAIGAAEAALAAQAQNLHANFGAQGQQQANFGAQGQPNVDQEQGQGNAQQVNIENVLKSLQSPQVLRDFPPFSGDPIKLHKFIRSIDNLMPSINLARNTPMYAIWQQCIRSKVIGEADDILELYGTGIEWNDIKATLITHYSDKRDEVSLTRDLFKIRQKGEINDYYGEISHIVSLLVNLLNINEPNHDVRIAKNSFYQQMGLKVFLSGLKDPLGPIIRAQSPQTLKDALRLCLEEANYHFVKPTSKEYFFSKARADVPPDQRSQPNPKNYQQNFPIQPFYRPFYPVLQFDPRLAPNLPQLRNNLPNIPPSQQPGPSWRVPTPNQFMNNMQAPHAQQKPALPPRKMVFPRPEPMDVDKSLQTRQINYLNRPRSHMLPNYHFQDYEMDVNYMLPSYNPGNYEQEYYAENQHELEENITPEQKGDQNQEGDQNQADDLNFCMEESRQNPS